MSHILYTCPEYQLPCPFNKEGECVVKRNSLLSVKTLQPTIMGEWLKAHIVSKECKIKCEGCEKKMPFIDFLGGHVERDCKVEHEAERLIQDWGQLSSSFRSLSYGDHPLLSQTLYYNLPQSMLSTGLKKMHLLIEKVYSAKTKPEQVEIKNKMEQAIAFWSNLDEELLESKSSSPLSSSSTSSSSSSSSSLSPFDPYPFRLLDVFAREEREVEEILLGDFFPLPSD